MGRKAVMEAGVGVVAVAEAVADQLPTDDYGRSPLVYAAQASRSKIQRRSIGCEGQDCGTAA